MEQLLLLEKEYASIGCTVDNIQQAGSSDAEVVEMRHPQLRSQIHTGSVSPSDASSCQVFSTESTQSSRKHHSEPAHASVTEGRSRFDRRRIFSLTKQESSELPDELQGQTEDNVFSDPQRSGVNQNGRGHFRRFWSIPAKLDNCPEPDCESSDALSQSSDNGDDKECSLPVKSILSGHSSMSKVGEVQEEGRDVLREKQTFEGSVCYTVPVADPPRKKSVTFEVEPNVEVKLSARGKAARSRFLSSGYGSQSDGSQVSQASNSSSVAMSDEALESSFNKDSFELDSEIEEPAALQTQSVTSIDGSIDGSGEETEGKGADSEAPPSQWKSSAEAAQSQNANAGSTHSSPGHTPEEGMDLCMELWCRQMRPEFHCTPCENDEVCGVPYLSIFDEDLSPYCNMGLEEELSKEECRLSDGSVQPSENGAFQDSQSANAESPHNKPSPTTKEECQRELFKRIIEERMLKYDHTKESLSELLDWFRNNIGEALTPSPKSPFFPMEGSLQKGNCKMQQALANTVQGEKCTGSKDVCKLARTCVMEEGTFAAIPPDGAGHIQVQPHHHQQQPQQALQDHSCIESQQGLQLQPSNLLRGSQPELVRTHPAVPHSQHLYKGPVPTFSQPTCQAELPVNRPPDYFNPCAIPTFLGEPSSSVNYQCSSYYSNVSYSLLDQLVNISQCTYSKCTFDDCIQTKRKVNSLKKALMMRAKELTNEDVELLKLLQEHYCTDCDLPKCSVPWCFLMAVLSDCHSQEKIQQELTSLLSNPMPTMLPDHSKFDYFSELDSSLQLSSMPTEWVDWVMLCPISQSFTVARALVPASPDKHWVIKMTYLHEERQLEMLRKLRDLQHEHIVKHNWVAASNSKHLLVVCTDFLPGLSLRDLLDQRVALSTTDACHYLKQILAACLHLHKLGLVYLNWMCSNLLLDQSCKKLKVTNFTSSVDLSVLASGRTDIGDTVKLTLPADVVPAELLSANDGQVTYNTDSWGVACVFHEMLLGVRPWFHLRHLRPEDIWKEIQQQIPPYLSPKLTEDTRCLVQACLQSNPEDRFSIIEILQRI